MNERIENQENPFATGDAGDIRRCVVDLIPENDDNQFSSLMKKGLEHLGERIRARFSELPANTYRILECGPVSGRFYYKLELNGEKIILEHQQEGEDAEFRLFGDQPHAIKVARKVIGEKVGLMKADMATFHFVFGFEH